MITYTVAKERKSVGEPYKFFAVGICSVKGLENNLGGLLRSRTAERGDKSEVTIGTIPGPEAYNDGDDIVSRVPASEHELRDILREHNKTYDRLVNHDWVAVAEEQ